jgi:hypothetical protein
MMEITCKICPFLVELGRKKERKKEWKETRDETDLMHGRAVTNSSTGSAAKEGRT